MTDLGISLSEVNVVAAKNPKPSCNEERELEMLRRQARVALRQYASLMNSANCGHHVLQYISAEAADLAQQFDAAMTKLKELDPKCPMFSPLTVKSNEN
jgi:hypothetical protein